MVLPIQHKGKHCEDGRIFKTILVQPVHSKGDQPWDFFGRNDVEAPILSLPDAKSRHIRRDPDAGKDLRQEEKGTTEDEMAGWHHRLDGCESE